MDTKRYWVPFCHWVLGRGGGELGRRIRELGQEHDERGTSIIPPASNKLIRVSTLPAFIACW